MERLVSFKNDFRQDFNQQETEHDGLLASIMIDGFPQDPDKEGRAIAEVQLTKHKEIVVDWCTEHYHTNETVLSLIEESKEQLRKDYNISKAANKIRVQAVWEFEVDTEDFDPKFVDVKGLAIDLTQRELADLLKKKEISAEDFDYEIVE